MSIQYIFECFRKHNTLILDGYRTCIKSEVWIQTHSQVSKWLEVRSLPKWSFLYLVSGCREFSRCSDQERIRASLCTAVASTMRIRASEPNGEDLPDPRLQTWVLCWPFFKFLTSFFIMVMRFQDDAKYWTKKAKRWKVLL